MNAEMIEHWEKANLLNRDMMNHIIMHQDHLMGIRLGMAGVFAIIFLYILWKKSNACCCRNEPVELADVEVRSGDIELLPVDSELKSVDIDVVNVSPGVEIDETKNLSNQEPKKSSFFG